ncbi:hypothetical protein Tsubulata_005355 [Turnera subulata]|uniref:Uncharacterized protein n=1 Tax=Turnera subulata TaxID=218843 RepID=A0A9Q0GGZ2_9ROSI|nr:hypothetical protein Tsubulata_005355 [Turnera subulata]
MWHRQLHSWEVDLCQQLLSELHTLTLPCTGSDKWYWRHASTAAYTVQSDYQVLCPVHPTGLLLPQLNAPSASKRMSLLLTSSFIVPMSPNFGRRSVIGGVYAGSLLPRFSPSFYNGYTSLAPPIPPIHMLFDLIVNRVVGSSKHPDH